MSDSQERATVNVTGVERVGDIIRRERLTSNIQMETIARDLKMNADYIRGIEESRYETLPAVAYVRVYIKSIAKYLGLNGDHLLELFSREMNIEIPDPDRERRDTISVKVQGTKRANPFLPLLYITVIILLIALLIRNGYRKGPDELELPAAADSLKIEIPADTGEPVDSSLPRGVSSVMDSAADSTKAVLPAGDTAATVDTVKKNSKPDSLSAVTAEKPAKKSEAPAKTKEPAKKKMSFEIEGKNDSSWVKIFADGKKVYDGFIHRRDELTFAASDSLNFMIGKNRSVRYKLNGTPLNIDGAGLKVIKLTGDTIELWRMNKWNTVFGSR